MSEVNVRISVSNLVQMDRLQTDAHRTPMVHQEQNADTARQEAARRLMAPVQPDQVEGKNVDPDAKREEERKRRKRRERQDSGDADIRKIVEGRGRVIDYTA